MTASEFTFLALGLVLGLAAGVALIEVLRSRPPAPREVRVTVAADAIPRRRSATLADDTFVNGPSEPARGGPADRRIIDDALPPGMRERRTPVRSSTPIRTMTVMGTEGVGDGPGPAPRRTVLAPTYRQAIAIDVTPGKPRALRVSVPVHGGHDPMLAEFRAAAASVAIAAMPSTGLPEPWASEAAPAAAATAVALADPPITAVTDDPVSEAGEGAADEGVAGTAGTVADGQAAANGPCADLRRTADERCELATRAREGASNAETALRTAQRAYDDHESRADEAARIADPRAVRAAKDAAQSDFRNDRNAAGSTDAVEAAARAWLVEINRINAEAREAGLAVAKEREAARTLALDLERLSVEADAARIGAETAEAACLAARQAAADCEELEATSTLEPVPVPAGGPVGLYSDDGPPGAGSAAGRSSRIFRLLRGDRAAMTELVTAMSGDDLEARRRWQLALSDLVDAIVADSIAASALEFPTDHPFWGPFSLMQDRDIASALSSLGYRFDGLGGWVDGRVPSQRDLSLAVGYAGLDPMRIRHWPTEAEMQDLYRDVAVAADEHLAAAAGDLTLGELVTMLGRRADGLTEVWNQWGRLRPLLLEER